MIGKHAPHGIEMLRDCSMQALKSMLQRAHSGYNDGLELQKTPHLGLYPSWDSEYRHCAAWVYQAPALVREELTPTSMPHLM